MRSREILQPHPQDIQNVGPGQSRNGSRKGKSYRHGGPAPDEGRRVTKEEYFERWYENPYPDIDVSYEWNNGILEAKPLPNRPQLDLYNWFLSLLQRNIETFKHAALINLETGFELKMPDPNEPSGHREAVRKPDVGVILDTNPTFWGRLDQRHFEGVCDLVVEAVSDSTAAEVLRDTEEKKEDYALGGVREYFILDPKGEHMRFYRLASDRRYQTIQPHEGLIRSDVMEGLQFRLQDLYRMPDHEQLALDPVYRGYVLPGYHVLATRAEREAQRAESEAQRAEREAQRADHEAAARQQAEDHAAAQQTARHLAEERATASEEQLRQLREELDRLRKNLT
ncbi:MAG: Uma2 family endonuclease [Caldilineaceae bacterium]|nr:Uma2 family endonuclease [Caldilineaceae bacterium]